MKRIFLTLLIGLLVVPMVSAQDDVNCEPPAMARELDFLYTDFVTTRGEIELDRMMAAAEEFHAAMGEILLRCGSTSVSINNDIAGDFIGSGTQEDPYAFGQPGVAPNGVSIRPIEFTRNAEEILGIDPTPEEEYLLVVVEVMCPVDARESCEVVIQNFQLIGDSGTVYDSEFVMTYDSLDVRVQAGRVRSGGIPFRISPDETSFNLVYIPEVFVSLAEQELTYYRTENFVRVRANTQAVVRGGPGVQFPPISSVAQGVEVVATGRDESGEWLQIETGWTSADLYTVEVGNLLWLPVIVPDSE
jgi:hypothetical protein